MSGTLHRAQLEGSVVERRSDDAPLLGAGVLEVTERPAAVRGADQGRPDEAHCAVCKRVGECKRLGRIFRSHADEHQPEPGLHDDRRVVGDIRDRTRRMCSGTGAGDHLGQFHGACVPGQLTGVGVRGECDRRLAAISQPTARMQRCTDGRADAWQQDHQRDQAVAGAERPKTMSDRVRSEKTPHIGAEGVVGGFRRRGWNAAAGVHRGGSTMLLRPHGTGNFRGPDHGFAEVGRASGARRVVAGRAGCQIGPWGASHAVGAAGRNTGIYATCP